MFKNIRREKSNILYVTIYLYIIVKKYDQSMLYE